MPTTAITADMVKKLRDQTGTGMMECKNALTEANGNFEEATTILRKRGLASAAKRAGRATSEGLIGARLSADRLMGILILDVTFKLEKRPIVGFTEPTL